MAAEYMKAVKLTGLALGGGAAALVVLLTLALVLLHIAGAA